MTTFLQCVTKFNVCYCMAAYVYFDILHTSVTQTVPQSIYDYVFPNSSCYAYVIRNLTSAWEVCNSTEDWKLEEIDPYLSFVNTPSLEPFVTVTPSSKFVWHGGDARLRYTSCFKVQYANVQHVFQYARFPLWHLEYAGCVCAAGI